MNINRSAIVVVAVAAVLIGVTYANGGGRTPVEYFKGHWHDEHGDAHDGPAHSGGLDAYGCHNASVPYHCHR